MNSQQHPRTSQIKHQQEFKKEILAPIYWFIGITIGGTLAVVLYSYFGNGDLSNAADISIVWLSLLMMVVGVIVLAALIFAIMGMVELEAWVDRSAGAVQERYEKINIAIRKINKKLSDPLRRLVGLMDRFRGE